MQDSTQTYKHTYIHKTTHKLIQDSTQTHKLMLDSTQTHRLIEDSTQTHRLIEDSTQTHKLIQDSTQTHRLIQDSTQTHKLIQDSTQTYTFISLILNSCALCQLMRLERPAPISLVPPAAHTKTIHDPASLIRSPPKPHPSPESPWLAAAWGLAYD